VSILLLVALVVLVGVALVLAFEAEEAIFEAAFEAEEATFEALLATLEAAEETTFEAAEAAEATLEAALEAAFEAAEAASEAVLDIEAFKLFAALYARVPILVLVPLFVIDVV
jgi:hypothetical protein